MKALPRESVVVDHIVISVTSWERSNRFYEQVLGAMIVEVRPGRYAYRFKNVQLNVQGPGSMSPSPAPRQPIQPGASELAFLWPGHIEDAIHHLERRGIPLAEGPVLRRGVQGEGSSVYFSDPDGNLLEFITYEGQNRETAERLRPREGATDESPHSE